MIACDWCAKKKEGKWKVVVTETTDSTYGKEVANAVLCDAHYEPIRAAFVKGAE